MKNPRQRKTEQMSTRQEWLLVFYSVPSQPVSNRMKIWRKLAKAGAVQLKGAVYILPADEEHEEFLQWLLGEVKTMGGDGAFVRSSEIRTLDDTDIRGLFIRQVDEEYRALEKDVDAVDSRIQSVRKGSRGGEGKGLRDQAAKLVKVAEETAKRDFFHSAAGLALKKRLQAIDAGLREAGGSEVGRAVPIRTRQIRDYQGRTWATRNNPFVDRMASAWLIRRFIDPKAIFAFVDERQVASLDSKTVAFDVRGGEFTHVGDLCTFEVLVKAFAIKDKAVRKIAEIVHDLDVKDDKHNDPGTAGVEDILSGIRKTVKSDADGLERGMAVFEMLYRSKTG